MPRLGRWTAHSLLALALVAGCGGGGGTAPANNVAPPDAVMPPDVVTPPDSVTPPGTVVLASERRVNTSSGNLFEPAITALADGGFVVTWLGAGLRAQRFDVNGAPKGGEVLVKADVPIHDIAGLNDGGYVVGWLGFDIRTQQFDAAGARLGGETRVNTGAVDPAQSQFGIAGLRNGGYVAIWAGLDKNIYAQRIDAAGAPAGVETRANTNAAYPGQRSAVAALADGGYAVTWISRNADGSGGGIFAQRFDRSGVRVGGETLVGIRRSSSDPGLQSHAIAGLAEGGYVVTWTDDQIYAQRVDAAGSRVGDAVVAATPGGSHSQVAALSDGGYVVTWDGIFVISAMTDVAAQRFDRAGARVGGQLWVNSYVPFYQGAPAVAGLADGGYVVTWVNAYSTGGADIDMQRFDASNVRQ